MTVDRRQQSEQRRRAASRWLLAALLTATGVAHIVVPQGFEQIVPRWLPGPATAWNAVATAAELGSAGLLANRRTARSGGLLAFVTLLGVWPANIQVAIDGGYRMFPGPFASTTFAWIRVPLQLPLLWWAASLARQPDDTDAA